MRTERGSFRSALAHRDYRWLLTGLAVSTFGNWAYNVALVVFVFEETVIEQIEQMIVLPALLSALYVGWKLWALRSEAKQASTAGVQS